MTKVTESAGQSQDFILGLLIVTFPGGSVDSHLQCRRCRRHRLNPWVGKMPGRRRWQPTPVFLPGESHGQRSLVGYSPWSRKEWDMTEPLITHTHSVVEGALQSHLPNLIQSSQRQGGVEGARSPLPPAHRSCSVRVTGKRTEWPKYTHSGIRWP